MGAFDGLKKSLQKSAGKALQSAQNLPAAVKEIDMAQVSDSLKDMAQKGGAALEAMKEKSKETKKAVQEALATEEGSKYVPVEDALKVMHLMMAVDGKIGPEETEKFDCIGRDLDPDYEEHKEQLVRECEACLQGDAAAADKEEYYDAIHDGIGDILRTPVQKKGATVIHGKLLIWDLLAIAYSDGDCADDERRLIRYIAKTLRIDRAVPLEMESTLQTLLTMENEQTWLRNSSRPYTEVEAQLNLLTQRQQAILQGIQVLITD